MTTKAFLFTVGFIIFLSTFWVKLSALAITLLIVAFYIVFYELQKPIKEYMLKEAKVASEMKHFSNMLLFNLSDIFKETKELIKSGHIVKHKDQFIKYDAKNDCFFLDSVYNRK